MREDKAIDPVKLDLCEYWTIEPVHPFSLLIVDHDSLIEVSPYEALVIKDASKISAIESLPNPEPQQLAADQSPTLLQKPKPRQNAYLQVQVKRLIYKIWIIGQSSQRI